MKVKPKTKKSPLATKNKFGKKQISREFIMLLINQNNKNSKLLLK